MDNLCLPKFFVVCKLPQFETTNCGQKIGVIVVNLCTITYKYETIYQKLQV